MNIKKYEEVKYQANKLDTDIKRAFKVLLKVSIGMTIIALILSIGYMKLGIENDSLKIENNELLKAIEMKNSIISDLQEHNMKLQEMIK